MNHATTPAAWPIGDGEMAALIRGFDWSGTPLGPIAGWPQSLRTAVDLTLASPVATILVCGPARVLIYNDACAALYGTKHPQALGGEGPRIFPELWPRIGPVYDRVFAGEALSFKAKAWTFDRGTAPDDGLYDAWFTPGRDEAGTVAFAHVTAVEVTDSARVAAALSKSEKRYRTLFENIDVGFCIVEVDLAAAGGRSDYRVIEANPAFYAQTGFPEAICGRWLREAVPTLEEHWYERYASVARTGRPIHFEQASEALNRCFEVDALPTGDAEGRQVAILFNDITARREDEARQREGAERQALLLKLSDAFRAEDGTDAIAMRALRVLSERLHLDRCYIAKYSLDEDKADFTHQLGNERVARLPDGIRLSDFPDALQIARGRTLVIGDVDGAEYLSDVDKRNMQALGMGALVAAAARRGEDVPLWTIVAVAADAREWTSSDIALIEEVTERTWAAMERCRTEAALRESEEQFRRSVLDAPIPVIMHAEDGEVLQISRSWTELTGYTIEDSHVIQTWLTQAYGFGGETVRDAVEQAFKPLEADKPMRSVVFEITTRHGERRQWSFSASSPGTLNDGRRFIIGMAEDITERTRAEAALRQREQHFSALFSASPAPLLILKADSPRFSIIEVNDAYLASTMQTRSALLGKGMFEAFPDNPDDSTAGGVKNLRASLERVRTLRQADTLPVQKYDIVRLDGTFEERWWDPVNSPVLGADGEVEAIIRHVFDVTQKHRTEAALRESEQRLRLVVEGARDYAIFTLDPQARVVDWYGGAEAVFGFSADEIRGQHASRLYTPEDRATGEEAKELAQARENGSAPNVRWHLHKGGGRVFIEGYVTSLRAPDGTLRGYLKIGHDVTERRLAEQRRREVERRFRTLVEGIPQLVWRAGNPGDWTWASPQWCDYTGQAEPDSHGWGWLVPVHPDDRGRVRQIWAEAKERGEFQAECRVFHAEENRYRWFTTRATPVRNEAGEVVEWLGTSTDVDDLRQMQERQRVLVAELQHRTRNLIGVVRSVSDKTARASADLPDFRGRFRERIDALSRVQGLLSRLNDHDRVTFDELIRTELSAMNGSAKGVMLAGPEGVRLRSSTVQTLAMALHELATNAVKYGALGQPDARLSIAWSVDADEDGGLPWLHIDWRESGVDMPSGPSPLGTGQGRELIERALPYQLGARTTYTLGPDGVHCTISTPVSASNDVESIA